MSSRSIGVMKVLCSASTHWCVMTSVSCSMSDALGLARLDVVAGGHQRQELLGALDRELGVLLEVVEEAGLFGQEPTEHMEASASRYVTRRG
jgi:hypothetical protein